MNVNVSYNIYYFNENKINQCEIINKNILRFVTFSMKFFSRFLFKDRFDLFFFVAL